MPNLSENLTGINVRATVYIVKTLHDSHHVECTCS